MKIYQEYLPIISGAARTKDSGTEKEAVPVGAFTWNFSLISLMASPPWEGLFAGLLPIQKKLPVIAAL